MNRRDFVFSSAAAAVSVRGWSQQEAGAVPVRLIVHPADVLAHVPESFIGLSYEVQELTNPAFFSAANTALIAEFRRLGPKGVLRLGGNTSDVGWWKDSPSAAAPEVHFREGVVGEPSKNQMYSLDPAAVKNLRGFLDATGWTCLFGINLGTNTPDRGAAEAAFVAANLGPKLEYFQLGNEPDLFDRHLRDPKLWSADAYFDEWLRMANAICARVPGARFGLPDTAGNPAWYAVVARRLAALASGERPFVASLSHHYYIGGPPGDPQMTISHILTKNEKVDTLATNIRAAAGELSATVKRPMPYRMSEGNTCFRGGKPGVSDVFAATLWAADYCLTLANDGYAGVNLHGGSSQMVANSLGGTLPGDDLVREKTEWHPRPYYTPIAAKDNGFELQPVGMGLQFAQHFAGGRMVKVEFDPGSVNAAAYAATMPGGLRRIAVINKEASQAVRFSLEGRVSVQRLRATALDARDVHWSKEPVQAEDRKAHVAPEIDVPAGSAVLIDSLGE